MELQQLKDYLFTVTELESAIYACKQAISSMKAQLNKPKREIKIPEPQYPEKPSPGIPPALTPPELPKIEKLPGEEDVYPTQKNTSGGFSLFETILTGYFAFAILVIKFFCGCAITAVLTAEKFIRGFKEKNAIPIPYLITCAIGGILFVIVLQLRKNKKDKAQAEAREAEIRDNKARIESEYAKAMDTYRAKKAIYDQEKARIDALYAEKNKVALAAWESQLKEIDISHEAFINAARMQTQLELAKQEELKISIQIMEKRRDVLEEKLCKLYNLDIIYPNFRDFIAVSQIYEYISSGIATELQGPDGAYALYMNDVRAARICSSIDDLKRTVQDGMQSLLASQHYLYQQVLEANSNLRSLDIAFGSMDRTITSYGNDITDLLTQSCNYSHDVSRALSGLCNDAARFANDWRAHANRMEESAQVIAENTHNTALNTALISCNQYLDMKEKGITGYSAVYI